MPTISAGIALRDQMSRVLEKIDSKLSSMTGNLDNMRSHMDFQDDFEKNAAGATKVGSRLEESAQKADNLRQKLQGAHNPMDTLISKAKHLAAALGLAKISQGAIRLSDNLTGIQSRLNLITGDAAEASIMMDKIMASANRSRGNFLQTADAVSKLGLQAREAFDSTNEMIAFSEGLNKTFKIAGTNAQGIESVMHNLTQALGSGVLRGQDLNAVFANAPMLVQMLADEMGVSIGKIRDLAAEGAISSEIVKNAVLRNLDNINAKFDQVPMTFADMWTKVKNAGVKAFIPIGQRMNAILNSERVQVFANHAIGAFQAIGNGILTLVDIAVPAANWIAENWDKIGPGVFGLVGAIAAYKAGVLLATAAQSVFNATLLANPLTWVMVGIAGVIGYIYYWIQAVGGLQIAWAMAVDWVNNGALRMQYGISTFKDGANLNWQLVKLGFIQAFTAIANFGDQVWVWLLAGLQDFVNKAIVALNQLIGNINSVVGFLGIGPIGQIQLARFGDNAATAAAKRAEERSQRIEDQQKVVDAISAGMDARDKTFNSMMDARLREQNVKYDRMRADIAAKNKANEKAAVGTDSFKSADFTLSDPALVSNVGGIKGDTSSMAESMEDSEEELVYLRDIAERDAINRFTTAEVKLDFTNHNTISSDMDMDGMMDYFTDRLSEAMDAAAEAGY